MAIARDPIYAALLARLQTKLGGDVTTYLRKYRTPDEVPAAMQPALICVATHQDPINVPGHPTRWTLHARVLLYVHEGRPTVANVAPESAVLQLVDQVERALERTPQEGGGSAMEEQFTTDLGGLVERAWIGGTVEIYQGPAEGGEQVMASIPIEMLVVA